MQKRSRGPHPDRLAGLGLATLVVVGGVVLGLGPLLTPSSDLEQRIELLHYRPGVSEIVLTRGGEASHVLLLTAIRASRQMGDTTPLPAGTAGLVKAAFDAVGPDDPAFSYGALEDLLVLQQRGELSDVALPASLRAAIRMAAARDSQATPSPDPNVASDRLVHIRAARGLGLEDLPDTDSKGWCSLADQAMAAARVDIAAVFAEVAGPDPTECAPSVSIDQWSTVVATAASAGEIRGMAYFAPTLLGDERSHALAELTLGAMEPDVAAGGVSFRTLEVVTRLARQPVALERIPEAVRFTRRQILLQGSVPDGMAVGDWDRILTAGVIHLAEVRDPRGDIGSVNARPVSSVVGDDDGMGFMGAAALRPADDLGLPPVTASLVAEAATIPGLLAAATLRSGDCAYVRAADLGGAVPAGLAPDLLVRYGLAAKAAETCGLEASLVHRLRSGVLDAAGPAGTGAVGERWASAEVTCLLGGALSDAARSTGTVVADGHLATVVGPDPYPTYTSENLYAALRLRELAANGCDGRGWWTGVYAAS